MNSLLILICLSSLLFSSCGYSLHRHSSLPFSEISIGPIENRTFEPGLQDRLYSALIDEFQKHGIVINPSAKMKLTGVIHKFDMVGIAEKDGIITEYTINIIADFRLLDEQGKAQELKNISSPFIVTFTGTKDFGMLLANKEAAEYRALHDVSMQLVGALIYK